MWDKTIPYRSGRPPWLTRTRKLTQLGRLAHAPSIPLGWPVSQAAASLGISRPTAYKWLERWKREGPDGLKDRSSCPQVDHNAIKFGQVTIVLVVTLAWLFDLVWLVPLLAVVLLTNVAGPARGPLRLIYRYVILPLRIVRSNRVADEPAPHRFAQGVGGVLLVAAAAALYTGVALGGWVLAALVAVLAAVNVLWNFCAGCFLFYQLRRAGLLRQEPTA